MTPHKNTKTGFTPVRDTKDKPDYWEYRWIDGEYRAVPVRKESVQ